MVLLLAGITACSNKQQRELLTADKQEMSIINDILLKVADTTRAYLKSRFSVISE